jgi:hypothetical protein
VASVRPQIPGPFGVIFGLIEAPAQRKFDRTTPPLRLAALGIRSFCMIKAHSGVHPKPAHSRRLRAAKHYSPQSSLDGYFQSAQNPRAVEWFDEDGDCELTMFAGPKARERALRYAERQYGHFEEVWFFH